MKPKKVIKSIVSPFQQFIDLEASSGILLLLTSIVAMAWANSPWSESYFHLRETKISLAVADFQISNSLVHWINDGLMAIFFFVVGCEIKREVMAGELSTPRKASLPFMAAIGGMVVPVALFLFLNNTPGATKGWGVPMATDIAFSIGILSLLGNRVTLGMSVFLTAFAIVDDIGAVLVIALFYSQDILWNPVLVILILLGILLLFNYLGVQQLWLYGVVSVLVWYYFLKSGIHPTIAGVLTAFCIPSKNKIRLQNFTEKVQDRVRQIRERWEGDPDSRFLPKEDINTIRNIERDTRKIQPPLQRLEENLSGLSAYFVMPVFAFANAGVAILGNKGDLLTQLTFTIAIALVFGKMIGIFSFSWIATKLGFGTLPAGTNWLQLLGLGLLGGVGFTMALFIANLAFDPEGLLDQVKIGVLIGSIVSGVSGYLLIRWTTSKSESAQGD